jgi:hypothetical protein
MYERIHGIPIIPPLLDDLPAEDRELWAMMYDLDQNTKYLENRQ